MGLMGTLAKVAIGYAASQAVNKASGGGGLSGIMEQLQSGGQMAAGNAQAGGNAMQDMLGQVMGGATDQAQAGAGGLQDMLGGLMGGGAAGGGAGGLQDMLGGLMGGGAAGADGQQSGGMQDMLGSLTGGGAGLAGLLAAAGGMAAATGGGGALAGMLDQMSAAKPDADAEAELMLRGMIQAAKADGELDATEQERIIGSLGEEADAEEIAFVQAQLAAPIDVAGLANDTPEAKRPEVYAMSLMAIKVDTPAEAQYLSDLAQAMGLQPQQVNMIHNQMGVQPLYT